MSDEYDTATQESRHVRSPANPLAATRDTTPLTFQPSSLTALLTHANIHGRGNGPTRQTALLQLQRTHGNRAVQRLIQAQPVVIQRCGATPCNCSPEKQLAHADAVGSPMDDAPLQRQVTTAAVIQRRPACEEGGCQSEAAAEHTHSATAAAVGGAAALLPPGNCTPAEHRALQDRVNQHCKGARRCTQNDDCATIWQRIEENAECIKARSTINAKCFRGGDPGHIAAVAAAVGALGNCWAVYNKKCQAKQQPIPVQVPVPVPAPTPVPAATPVPTGTPAPQQNSQPIIDKSFMDRMAAITGLTGTALVLYLIISEGSRLFPPRNLVPIP